MALRSAVVRIYVEGGKLHFPRDVDYAQYSLQKTVIHNIHFQSFNSQKQKKSFYDIQFAALLQFYTCRFPKHHGKKVKMFVWANSHYPVSRVPIYGKSQSCGLQSCTMKSIKENRSAAFLSPHSHKHNCGMQI